MTAATVLTEEEQLQCINLYLAAGNGRGRLMSAATVYDGKAGYFCVHPIWINGERQGECILFVCAPHEDILITAFPLLPKACGMSAAEQKRLYDQARRAYPPLRASRGRRSK